MGALGQLLRETREAKKLDLKQIENSTRIRARYLEALEEAEYDQLPTPGHVYGFLRSYAQFLGLDWGEIEAMYHKENPSRHLSPQIFHPQDIALVPRRAWFKADLVLISVVLIVLAVVGSWAFMQYGRPLLAPTPTPTKTPTLEAASLTNTPARAATVTPTRTASPTPTVRPTWTVVPPTATATLDTPLKIATPTPPPTHTPSPTPTRAQGVSLKIKVVERTWLQVTLDGKEQPGQLLEADYEQEWQAQSAIYLICGNAGGVLVTVNGQEIGKLGERGQVVEKTWTPQGEVTPTPVSEPTATRTPTPTATPTTP